VFTRSPAGNFLQLMIIAILLVSIGCSPKAEGKIPITTSSDKALSYYLEGRDFAEKLRAEEARQAFEKAIAEDPDFAMAYVNAANVQPDSKGFFEMLDKAVALADKVSEGERLLILGAQAGANGLPMLQREHYQKLVQAYPNDERAHNILGNHYFGLQEYPKSIEVYEKALAINPEFSPPYNQLGYAHRFLENFDAAEQAFTKYIELIPDDPNPHDSYAELLLKMGRYEESLESYRKALSVDPNFVASHVGIATNLVLMGKHDEARNQIQVIQASARNDGERRAAHFVTAVSYVDEGKPDLAQEELKKQYALAEKIDDAMNMAGDLISMGNICLETGRNDEALNHYQMSLRIVEASGLSGEVKENARRADLYNIARVALAKGDLVTAKEKQGEFRRRAEEINSPLQIQLAHELEGLIALQEKAYEEALTEFQQASQEDAYNIFRMALVYQGKGDQEKAREYFERAVRVNTVSDLNYAFIKGRAKQMLEAM